MNNNDTNSSFQVRAITDRGWAVVGQYGTELCGPFDSELQYGVNTSYGRKDAERLLKHVVEGRYEGARGLACMYQLMNGEWTLIAADSPNLGA